MRTGRSRWRTGEEGHGDNAGASAYGGLVAALGGAEAPRAVTLQLSERVGFAFAAPPIRVSTRAARAALPATVSHRVAAGAVARAAAVLSGLATGDPELLRRGFEDALHVPYRLPLIPGAGRGPRGSRGGGCLGWDRGPAPAPV